MTYDSQVHFLTSPHRITQVKIIRKHNTQTAGNFHFLSVDFPTFLSTVENDQPRNKAGVSIRSTEACPEMRVQR